MTATLSRLVPIRRTGLRARRRSLFIGGAAGAAAMLALHPQPLRAQGFQGTGIGTSNVTINPTNDLITIGNTGNGSNTAIINWQASQADFLPSSNTATFQGTPGFAVLNRILGPTDNNILIQINGTVNSDAGSTIIFSSPGGLLVGGTAVFNVGNLVLSTLNVETLAESGDGPFFIPNSLGFNLVPDTGASAVEIQAGATINALSPGSYVAMVAPRIVQGGELNVYGSTAYVAAEGADITASAGLFDIAIRTGTTDENGIVHTGSTGGPTPPDPDVDTHSIFFVAVPKNVALTALLSGSIGYDSVTTATEYNGTIILTAGYGSVTSGKFGDTVLGNASTLPSSFQIGGAGETTITSSLFGFAVTNAEARTGPDFGISFGQNVRLDGSEAARMVASDGQSITVAGGAVIDATRVGTETAPNATGGEALVRAESGGTIDIAGGVFVSAAGIGYEPSVDAFGNGIYGDGIGGTASIVADGGTVTIGGAAILSAGGLGGSVNDNDGQALAGAGYGRGGTASIEARNGTVTITGDVTASASGTGGDSKYTGVEDDDDQIIAAPTGDGFGGAVSLIADNGTIDVGGYTTIDARGFGGVYEYFGGYSGSLSYAGVNGGNGQGGTVTITSASTLYLGNVDINVSGYGGYGSNGAYGVDAGNGGDGIGGDVAMDLGDSTVVIDSLRIQARGEGGSGGDGGYSYSAPSNGGDGGDGMGGNVTFTVGTVGSVTIAYAGNSDTAGIDVSGDGGNAGDGSNGYENGGNGGTGGNGRAGSIAFGTTGGTIEITSTNGLVLAAEGSGGNGGDGGDAGAEGAQGANGGDGGLGRGGAVDLTVAGGSLVTDGTDIEAGGGGGFFGSAGYGDQGGAVSGAYGAGEGGNVLISVTDGAASGSASLGDVDISVDAYSCECTLESDVAGTVTIEDLGTVAGGLRMDSLYVTADGGAASLAGPAFQFTSNSGPVIIDGPGDEDGDVYVEAVGDIVFTASGNGGLEAAGRIYANSYEGSIELSHAGRAATAATVSGSSVDLYADVSIVGTTDSLVEASSGTASLSSELVDVGTVTATVDINISGGEVRADLLESGNNIYVSSGGDAEVIEANAGNDFRGSAGFSYGAGVFTAGTITAAVGSDIYVSAYDDVRLDNGTASGLISLSSYTGSVLSDGLLTANQLNVYAGQNIDLNDVDVVQDLFLTANNGFIDGNSFASDEDIFLTSSQSVTLASADAGDDFYATGPVIDLGTVNAYNDIDIDSGGTVSVDGATANGAIIIDAADGATLGTFAAGVDVRVSADTIDLASATAGRDVTLNAYGAISVDFAQAGDDFRANTYASFTGGEIVTTGLGPDQDACSDCQGGGYETPGNGSNIVVNADGNLALATGNAATMLDLESFGGDVTSATLLESGDDILLNAYGDISVAEANAGDDFLASAGGAFTGDTVTALVGSDIFINAVDDVRLDNGEASGLIELTSSAGSVLSDGALIADRLTVSAALNIDLNDVDVVQDLSLATSNGFIDGNSFTSENFIFLNSSQTITVAAVDAGKYFSANAAGDVDLGTVNALSFNVDGANIQLDAGTAAKYAGLFTYGELVVGSISGDDGVSTYSGGNTQIDSASSAAGTIEIDADGSATLGVLTADVDVLVEADVIDLTNATAGRDVTLEADDGITVGTATAGDDFRAFSDTTFAATSVTTTGLGEDADACSDCSGGYATPGEGSNIAVYAGGDLALASGSAATTVELISYGGNVSSATLLESGDDILLDAYGNIVVAEANAGDDFIADAGGSFTGDTVTALVGSDIIITADDDVRLDNGDASGLISLTSYSGSVLSDGLLNANELRADAALNIDLNDVTVVTDLALATSNGFIDGNSFTSDGNIRLTSSQTIALANGDAADNFTASAAGAIDLGTVTAGLNLFVSGDAVTLDDGTAGSFATILADSNLTIGSLVAGNDAFTSSGGVTTIDAAESTSGSVVVFADGAADLGDLDAGVDIRVDAAAIDLANAEAGRDVTLEADGAITVGFAQAGDDFRAYSDTATFTGTTVITTGLGEDADYGGSGGGYSDAVDGSNIVIASVGDLRLDNGQSPDIIDLTSSTGSILSDGTLDTGQLIADAALDIALNDVFTVVNLFLVTTNGDISGNSFNSSTGSVLLDSSGSIDLAEANAAEDIDLEAAGDVTIGTAEAAGDFFANAGGAFTGGAVTATDIEVTAVDDLRLDNGTAAGTIDLVSTTGSVLSGGLLAANRLIVEAAADIALNDVEVVESLFLETPAGNISGNSFTSGGSVTLISSGLIDVANATAATDVNITAADDLVVEDVTGVNINLTSTAGSVTSASPLRAVNNLQLNAAQDIAAGAVAAGGNIQLTAGGDIGIAGLLQAGGTVDADAGGAFTMLGDAAIDAGNLIVDAGSATLNRVDADSVDVFVNALATFEGAVNAGTIFVGSGDIDITAAGALGASATNLVILQTLGGGQAVLGGTAQGTGYTLNNAEFGRISGAEVRFSAASSSGGSSATPNLLIRDLAIQGRGLSNGRIGDLEISTQGFARVEGNVAFTGARAGDQFDLRAAQRLEVLTPSGSLVMTDAAGALGGLLQLFSGNIVVASPTLAGQLRADPNLANKAALLLANDGPNQPNGYVRANAVTLFVGSSLFVQNSGTATSLAGITVGTGPLVITEFLSSTPSAVGPQQLPPLDVVAFGRRVNPDGSTSAGDAFFAEVDFTKDDGTVYLDTAEFNTCFINSGCPVRVRPDPPSQDVIQEVVEGDDDATTSINVTRTELVDVSFSSEELIEEPVTSGADSVLWDCDRDNDGDCDEDDVDG